MNLPLHLQFLLFGLLLGGVAARGCRRCCAGWVACSAGCCRRGISAAIRAACAAPHAGRSTR